MDIQGRPFHWGATGRFDERSPYKNKRPRRSSPRGRLCVRARTGSHQNQVCYETAPFKRAAIPRPGRDLFRCNGLAIRFHLTAKGANQPSAMLGGAPVVPSGPACNIRGTGDPTHVVSAEKHRHQHNCHGQLLHPTNTSGASRPGAEPRWAMAQVGWQFRPHYKYTI